MKLDPAMSIQSKPSKLKKAPPQNNIYMNEEQYRGLIDILEQQNRILNGIKPEEGIQKDLEQPQESYDPAANQIYESGLDQPVNISVPSASVTQAPNNITNGKTKLDSQRIIRKGIQTAPRGTKRPSVPARPIVPPVPINHFNNQTKPSNYMINYLTKKLK